MSSDRLRTDTRLRLAERLAARLCHDLSGALGTVMGALELATEDPDAAAEALPVAAEAAAALGARLRLLRAAWGGAAELGTEELRALAEGLRRPRLTIDLSGLAMGTLAAAEARLVLNLLLLAADCLGGGGVVRLSGEPGREMVLTIDGPRAAWPPGFAALLASEEACWQALDSGESVAARAMQAPLTALMARAATLRLSMLVGVGTPDDQAPPLLLA